MKKIKAVIFDLDGTLANTLPLCIHAFKEAIQPLINRSLSDEEIISTFGPSEEGTIMALAPQHYDKGIANYLQLYEQYHDMCPTAFDGIQPLLQSLKEKNIRIAMVTGKGKYSTAISLKHFALTDYFEVIETGSVEGPGKPRGIQAVTDYFATINKDEMIYVGDAPSDISASRKVGMPVIAAAWAATAEPGKLIPLQPDAIFYSVKNFAAWLTKKI